MSDVMSEGQSFRQVFVQTENGGNGPRYLRNLDRVCETVAKVVMKTGGEDLRLVFETPERPSMNDTVAVPAEIVTPRVSRLRIASPTAFRDRKP